LTVVYLCTVSYSLVLQSIPPVLSLIINELRLSYHQAGALMSLFALPGIFVALPAGVLADRYGIMRVGLVSFLATIAGVIMFATGETFALLATGRIVAGAGSASLMIVAPQGIAQWFKGRGIGSAMGIYNTALPVGFITSLNLFPLLASHWGWRSGIWASALFTAAALVAFFLKFQDRKPEVQTASFSISLGKERILIGLVSLCWAFCQACIISLFTFAPDFMVGRGLSLESAGFNTSLVLAGPLCLSPLVGYCVDKIGNSEKFIAAGGLGMAALLLFVPFSKSHPEFLMLAVGVCAALIPASVYSLAARIMSQTRLGFGFGVLAMANNAGVFVGPQLVGMSLDAVGSYTAGFVLMALFAVTGATIALILSLKQKRSLTRSVLFTV
jgi:predicted MFS family arabinose efflux permease